MAKYLRQLLLIIFFIVSMNVLYVNMLSAQTQTTVSKTCGKCGKAVSEYSKAGDRCPYCGVMWGRENTTTSTSTSTSTISNRISDFSTNPIFKDYMSTPTPTKQIKSKESKANNPFDIYSTAQTEDWVSKRLKSNVKNYVRCGDLFSSSRITCTHYSDFTAKIINDKLIIKYTYENYESKISIVPINQIDYLNGKNDNFSIKTKTRCIAEISSSSTLITNGDYVTIGFNCNAEEKLVSNLEKALLRLASAYKSSSPYISSSFVETVKSSFRDEATVNRPPKAEIQAWVLQKLNSYTDRTIQTISGHSGAWVTDNYKFSFDNDNLIVSCSYDQNGTGVYNHTSVIPVCECDFMRAEAYSSSNVMFYSSRKNIRYRNEAYSPKIETGENENYRFKMKLEKEDDLFSRLAKAFATLKSYCSASNSKELF